MAVKGWVKVLVRIRMTISFTKGIVLSSDFGIYELKKINASDTPIQQFE